MTDAGFAYLDSLERVSTSPRLLAAIQNVRRAMVEEGQQGDGELHFMVWSHPVHGEIREVTCEWHRRQVLHALRMLGIGCEGERVVSGGCLRCMAEEREIAPSRFLGRSRP